MSAISNNNTTNTPSVGSSPVWGQAGCGSVGYAYSAIIASMNALNEIVQANANQSETQSKVIATFAKAEAKAQIDGGQEQADATKSQAVGSIIAGACSIVGAAGAFISTYSDMKSVNENQTQQNKLNTLESSIGSNTEIELKNFSEETQVKPNTIQGALKNGNSQTLLQTVNGESDTDLTSAGKNVMPDTAGNSSTTDAKNTINDARATLRTASETLNARINRYSNLFQAIGNSGALATGIGSYVSASSQLSQAKQQAAATIDQNALSQANNMQQTFSSNLGKAYDEELQALGVLSTLQQASRV